MGKNTFSFVVLMLFAGLTGGVCAFLLARSGGDSEDPVGPDRPPAREAAAPAVMSVVSETEWLAMQAEVNGLARKVEDLTTRLEAASARLEEASSSSAASSPPDEVLARSAAGGPMLWTSGGGGSGGRSLRLAGLGKAAELMALPEEERWAKIREDLSLDAYQESELRRMAKEMQGDGLSLLTQGQGGEAQFDPMEFIGKMVEKRKKTREELKNLLTDDQYEKFDEGGYGGALGLGTTSFAVSYGNLGAPVEPRGK